MVRQMAWVYCDAAVLTSFMALINWRLISLPDVNSSILVSPDFESSIFSSCDVIDPSFFMLVTFQVLRQVSGFNNLNSEIFIRFTPCNFWENVNGLLESVTTSYNQLQSVCYQMIIIFVQFGDTILKLYLTFFDLESF